MMTLAQPAPGDAFFALLWRDLRLALRLGGGGVLAAVFFAIVVTLIPLGVGPDRPVLERIAPGILWSGLMLATLLTLDRLFQADFEDGSLDLFLLSPLPLEVVVLAKCLAHWLTTALPLILVAPLLGLMMDLSGEGQRALVLALLLGTPALSLIGAIGAALTVGMRRGGLLLSLIALPLYVPVLIFGVGAVGEALMLGSAADPASVVGLGGANLWILAAGSLFAAALAPFAAAAALRLQAQ